MSAFCFLIVVLLGLTACGGLPFSSAGNAPTAIPHVQKHLSTTLDSCSLVTPAQIEQIIKAPVTVQEPDKINGQYPINMCNYNLQSEGGVSMTLVIDQDATSAKSYFTHLLATDSAMEPKPIDGLGDQAFVEQKPFSVVYVLKDNAIIAVGLAVMMDDTTRKNQEIQIARIALQNM